MSVSAPGGAPSRRKDLIVTVALLSTMICAGALTLQRAIYPLTLLVGFLSALRGLGAPERVLAFRAFARAVADVSNRPTSSSL
ncbi:hypothetical protein GCM10010387_08400 [Streptomyces inusitatus]|uniref:Uncharacterized protein n=1 Tax=Streptomyces inusitatus TaxID=68221 RepID=A0A918PQX3_9ACTN|nr:hypothetical protein [Streptomyces inusitatus]GGZ18255.1 hypothetical protein GCM10010387_08400 [Streptomyces inusitatus]